MCNSTVFVFSLGLLVFFELTTRQCLLEVGCITRDQYLEHWRLGDLPGTNTWNIGGWAFYNRGTNTWNVSVSDHCQCQC